MGRDSPLASTDRFDRSTGQVHIRSDHAAKARSCTRSPHIPIPLRAQSSMSVSLDEH